MKSFALTVPGYGEVQAPKDIPTGGSGNLGGIIGGALSVMIFIAILACLGYVIYGGYLWITSSGDKQKLAKAQKSIVFAIIGLIITVLSFVMITFVGQILGVDAIIDLYKAN